MQDFIFVSLIVIQCFVAMYLCAKFFEMVFCTGAKHVDMDEAPECPVVPQYHVISTALLNDLTLEEAEELRDDGDDRYNEAKAKVYKLIYGSK